MMNNKNTLIFSMISFVLLIVAGCSNAGNFELTFRNVSDDYTLSPGVYALHGKDVNLNFKGEFATNSLKTLAETGETTSLDSDLRTNPDLIDVFTVSESIAPGEELKIPLKSEYIDGGVFISGYTRIEGTDDDFAYVGGLGLFDRSSNNPIDSTYAAQNYDAGTQEPDAIVDLGEGVTAENISAPVSLTQDIDKTILQLVVTPK